jgi:hypothetical protein
MAKSKRRGDQLSHACVHKQVEGFCCCFCCWADVSLCGEAALLIYARVRRLINKHAIAALRGVLAEGRCGARRGAGRRRVPPGTRRGALRRTLIMHRARSKPHSARTRTRAATPTPHPRFLVLLNGHAGNRIGHDLATASHKLEHEQAPRVSPY